MSQAIVQIRWSKAWSHVESPKPEFPKIKGPAAAVQELNLNYRSTHI